MKWILFTLWLISVACFYWEVHIEPDALNQKIAAVALIAYIAGGLGITAIVAILSANKQK